MLDERWRKAAPQCLQRIMRRGRAADGGAEVRDSKDQRGPVLRFTRDEWAAFLAGMKAGPPGHELGFPSAKGVPPVSSRSSGAPPRVGTGHELIWTPVQASGSPNVIVVMFRPVIHAHQRPQVLQW